MQSAIEKPLLAESADATTTLESAPVSPPGELPSERGASHTALAIRRWVVYQHDREVAKDDFVVDAPGVEAVAARCAGVVLPTGDEQRATTLLAAGAACIFVGDAALRESTVIERLVAAHGAGRIGIYARVRRQTISWSFETVSNADFKTVTPSHCEPAWEVIKSDGSGSGALAQWWLAALGQLGASRFLVQVDIADDTDLNLCAGLVEKLGDALWIGPLVEQAPRLVDWVDFGRCRQLVLPESAYAQRQDLLGETSESA